MLEMLVDQIKNGIVDVLNCTDADPDEKVVALEGIEETIRAAIIDMESN